MWRLRAHGTARVPATAEDVVAAAGLAELVRVEAFDGTIAHVRAAALVGVVSEGLLRVEVSAGALSRAAVLAMAGAYGRFGLRGFVDSSDPDEDLLTVIARAFCDATARLLARGLVREYAEREGPFDTVRGEVELDRWFGPESPEGGRPRCRVRERTLDLPEHRLLRWALLWVAANGAVPKPTRLRAAGLAARIGGVVAEVPTSGRLRRTGLFAAYAEPLDLAEIVGAGVTGGAAGEGRGRGFVLDADRLYERWVLGVMRESLPAGWSAEGGVAWSLSEGGARIGRVMDTVVYDAARSRVAIVDAKNKDLSRGVPDRDDVHQLVAYMATTGCRRGYLVGVGATGQEIRREWTLRAGVGRIGVVALPGSADPRVLVAAAAAWWAGEVKKLAGGDYTSASTTTGM